MNTGPVQPIPTDDDNRPPEPTSALCLSGGGYRAMVFHIGVLWRLYETGLLKNIKRISSVSGGSITAGQLALAWRDLSFGPDSVRSHFIPKFVEPLRAFAGVTIDAESVILGALLPGSVGDRIAKAYDEHLFHGKTLQDLPDEPRFVINATNVQSGALWRFMKLYMRDYRVGKVKNPRIPLAQAVAASSAFPPVLSPFELRLRDSDFEPGTGLDLQRPPFTTRVVLSDGGVYDNLGLETAWKRHQTVLVSDAGGKTGRGRAGDGLAAAFLPGSEPDRQPGAFAAQAPGHRLLQIGNAQGRLLGHPHRHRGLPTARCAQLSAGSHDAACRTADAPEAARRCGRRTG